MEVVAATVVHGIPRGPQLPLGTELTFEPEAENAVDPHAVKFVRNAAGEPPVNSGYLVSLVAARAADLHLTLATARLAFRGDDAAFRGYSLRAFALADTARLQCAVLLVLLRQTTGAGAPAPPLPEPVATAVTNFFVIVNEDPAATAAIPQALPRRLAEPVAPRGLIVHVPRNAEGGWEAEAVLPREYDSRAVKLIWCAHAPLISLPAPRAPAPAPPISVA